MNKKYFFFLLIASNIFYHLSASQPHIGGVPLGMLTYVKNIFSQKKTNLRKSRFEAGICYLRTLHAVWYRSTSYETPLVRAAREKDLHKAKLLLETGSLVNCCQNERTPAIEALNKNDCDMLRLFLHAGLNLNCRNKSGFSLLGYALAGHQNTNIQKKMVYFLVRHGVNVNQGCLKDGRLPPLSWGQEDKNIARLLLENGAKGNNDHDYCWADSLLNQLKNEYYSHQQQRDKNNLTTAITSHSTLVNPLALMVAEYAVLDWEEQVELRKQKNIGRGKISALRGIEYI